jgi:ribosomal-protein-alanine N-acetyltransferase
MRVENLAFAADQYPAPVFVQYHELFPKTFLVAEAHSGIVGYLLAGKSPDVPTRAVIFSMGVIPEEQGKGVGRALLTKALAVLTDAGVAEVELTVSPESERAFKFYRSMDFKESGSLAENLFGPGKHRIRMTKVIEAGCSAKDEHLLDEVSASLAFTNLLVAVSVAALAGLIAVNSTNFVAYWYVIVALLGSLYSSIFYANVSGLVARLRGTRNLSRPLIIGNTLSEYMGVYPFVLVFPLLVLSLSKSTLAAGLAAVANGIAFVLYHFSHFNIFRRQSPRWWCWVALALVTCTAVAHGFPQLFGCVVVQVAVTAASSLALVALTVRGIWVRERGST